ncbi:MAG TPA: glucokinase [Candidatus Binataceae bacterium]|nr:glucokinase [Candidatus Binataceae bacterium]
MATVILAGDIGGTNTRLGLFRVENGAPTLIGSHRYATAHFASLEAVCADFLRLSRDAISSACFGVPGPIIGGAAHATNVSWTMREESLARALNGTPVRLINDLGATAYGVMHLDDSEVSVLQKSALPINQGNVAVIAAGTGLGEAGLAYENGRHYAIASEGGHASFAPQNDEQVELYRYLRARFGHVSSERVLSGPGLFNIYSFLRTRRTTEEPKWLTELLEEEDAGAVISEAALERRDPECIRALEIFVDIYGAEAGNLALKMLALGGVYVSGGIAPKILPALRDGRFMRAFADKGRLNEMLSKIEVRVAMNEDAALIGAAWLAASML